MPRSLLALALLVVLSLTSPGAAFAQDRPLREARQPQAATTSLPADVTSTFTVAVAGRTLSFQATAGSIRLDDDGGAPQAEVAYVAYRLDGTDVAKRPVTFAINGGPGAASAWLHLGAIGPWRLPMKDLAPSSAPALVDNAETWLDFTDLVFIDPPGTGYSKILGGEDARKRYWSVDGDIDALSDVIRRWLVSNQRLTSPKFIVGESYGGFRGPRLAEKLAASGGVGISGLVLVSPVLDFGAFFGGGPSDPFPLLTRLPSYAAAYREKSGPVSRADLADVERYAVGDYLADWLRGPRDHAAVERREQRLAALTGIDAATVRRLGGDLEKTEFLREFERAEGKVVAFYDGTTDAYDPFPASTRNRALDPILPGFDAPFTSAIEDLYARRLGWKLAEPYALLNDAVERNWNWDSRLSAPESLTALRRMLALDPHFRVLISHGLTDLQAPYFATQLQLNQIPDYGPPGRLILKVYGGGHMHYSRDDSRRALREDARRLIEGAADAAP